MNTGIQLILLVVGTIGTAIVVVMYRDLIFVGSRSTGRRRAARPAGRRRYVVQRRPAPARPAAKAEPKPAATVSAAVSGYVMQDNDAEMIAYFAIAKLIQAKMITETAALTTVFNVRAGNSQAYKEARSKLKEAQKRLENAPTIAA